MAISLEEAERMFRNRKGVDMSKIRKEIAAAEAVRNGEKNVQKPDTSDSKLGNRKATAMGMEFASELEMGHGMILEYMKKAGLFDRVEFQVPFVLLEKTKYFDPISETEKAEQPIKYILDFVVHKGSKSVAIDSKGFATDKWILKRKMFRARYPEFPLAVVTKNDNIRTVMERFFK